MITSGEGKYRVFLDKKKINDDLILHGGDKPHIGGVVVCEPNKNMKILKLGEHKDYIVLKMLARHACEKYATTVAAIGGVHIDDASKKEIDIVVKNCKNLLKHV